MLEKRWLINDPPEEEVVKVLCESINVSQPIASILAQRGKTSFDEAKAFFRPKLSMLHDPFLMADMHAAVDRVYEAIQGQEKILVYGDYDVDGTTSVALFFGAINKFYHRSDFYIPDRYKEGYGISKQGIDFAIENGYSLIVALDCGIKSVELISYARDNGIDFVICDHHRPGDELPPAIALLDPKRADCEYPYKELPGCGIGFKLLQALSKKYPELKIDPFDFLDLVAVSIASDIVPIDGENRVLAYYGIKKLMDSPKPGLKALMRLAGVPKKVTITGIVFGLAPRINAAGRIDHAKTSVHMLLSESEEEAYHFCDKLNLKNNQRRDFDSSITQEALAMIEESDNLKIAKSTVLFNNSWHKGVIGIVASRCIEKFHRPTIILTESNNKATGSARSVPGFDVYEAISQCSDLLDQFGGHMYAAGLTMDVDKVPLFQEKFEEVVSGSIPEELLTPQIEIDTVIDFDQITANFFSVLDQMEPFGPANPKPVFMAENVFVYGHIKLIKGKHLKFTAQQVDRDKKFEVIGFNLAPIEKKLADGVLFKMVFTIEENHFRGMTSIQLNVKDIKFD
ncbi:single-stranded-DNA-specific exonuclease RecJ [Fulvivirga sp. RKSG066]|uniref:single-stranded-DNA-specific exonuclease RecJ n=1 Tax=Fulvivirga aurantia TaxID=2529383 RepID=UPI0012BD71E9|nr:single-stranded-DNA-specific exonuclease RecJ [Fulvivirga aurantia]MTI21893.1 single-stranded-DNA-specific exonuclease RecJ [Fulvivirga aurantia]